MDDDLSKVKLRHDETERIVKDFDFSDFERIHGYELTLFEKCDAVYRFNEFVSILRAEYGRMIGTEFFITKDSGLKQKKS